MQTKQKQQQNFNRYQQMQQFPRAPSAPLLSRVPSTRSPIGPLLSLPNQPPHFPPDHHHHHHHHHQVHPGPRMANMSMVGHPPPPSRSLLGPRPMMQQPVVMHQMPGMPVCPGKRLPPPFGSTTGVRQSLLGLPAFGTPLKNTNMGFPHGSQQYPHVPYRNKGSAYNPQRRRENGHTPAGKSTGPMSKSKTSIKPVKVEKKLEVSVKENQASCSEQAEPPVKKQKNQGADKQSESGDTEQKSADMDSSMIPEQEDVESHSAEAEEDMEQGRTAEVQGVGSSLKVTIQRTGDSRAFSTGLEEIAAAAAAAAAAGQDSDNEKNKASGKFSCYICNITCSDQQDFQTHMISLDHQQRMMEIQHLSNTCLATLLPQMKQTLQGTGNREKKEDLQRWCALCQCHFTGDLIEHRRTKKHKMAKVSSRPFCTVCERHFRTPRKFVEHMKSPEHKQRVEELKEEMGPEVMEELITVDAIGCFEGEDDYEEGNEDEEDDGGSQKDPSEEMNDGKEYDPNTHYGTTFVVPVAGFLCKLCHKFYHFESRARETHCKSLMHYRNLQKFKAMLNQPQEDEESVASSAGDAQVNSQDCDAEMEDKCEEES